MTGKIALNNKDENRGGPREGAGRPKETLSQGQLREMLQKCKDYANANEGRTPDDYLLMIIHGDADGMGEEKIVLKDRLAAIKLWKDNVTIPVSEDSNVDRELGPTIYLPEERPDPAKVVSISERQ